VIFCDEDFKKSKSQKLGIYVWIDGVCPNTQKRIVYGPFASWKEAVSKGDEMLGRNNYNLYHTIHSNMREFVNSLNRYGEMKQ
jgi:hypothetical protein